MTNDQIRMTKEFPMTNSTIFWSVTNPIISFELCHSLVIRTSSLVIHPAIPLNGLRSHIYGQ